MIDAARGAGARYGDEEIDETVAFLEWLREHHFVFLGTRDYAIVEGPAGRRCSSWPGRDAGSCARRALDLRQGPRSQRCRRACASASRAATCC